MSVSIEADKRKITVQTLKEMQERGEKISILTVYGYMMASILDQAECCFSWRFSNGRHDRKQNHAAPHLKRVNLLR